ncbi:protein artichoke-like isoform X2 [Wyeomyia smithii]|uniref:protein artichoke-like isoform X2 n=1 Tax=Wyeomyia smithii TaxID=174621 RepID=UPI002467EE58|nr:protein artichoke-like isoform X2 [Wyeomyia smithii]
MLLREFTLFCFCVILNLVFAQNSGNQGYWNNQNSANGYPVRAYNYKGQTTEPYKEAAPENFPDNGNHSPLSSEAQPLLQSRKKFDHVCSIETENYDCQFKDVILRQGQRKSFGPESSDRRRLTFHNSTLEYLPKSLIDAFPSMELLNIEELHIKAVEPNAFQNAANLLELYMGKNLLTAISSDTFFTTTNLKYLDLSENNIESLPPKILNTARILEAYNINSNRITELPENLYHNKLKQIMASGNLIRTIRDDHFYGTPQLIHLDLSRNELNYFNLQQLNDNQHLSVVNVNHNHLSSLYVPRYVRTLLAKNNSIETVETEHCLAEEIDLQSNKIENEVFLMNCNNLRKIDLSHNLLQSFKFNVIGKMHQLEYLSLAHNYLFEIDGSGGNSVLNLRTLDLSYNHLSYGPAMRINAEELHLENNQLVDFNFKSFKSLQKLGAANNKWNCKILELQSRPTILDHQDSCEKNFIASNGICCKHYSKAFIERLIEVSEAALWQEKFTKRQHSQICRSEATRDLRLLNTDKLLSETAAGDSSNKNLINELNNISNRYEEVKREAETSKQRQKELTSRQKQLAEEIERQRHFYAVIREGLISNQEKLSRVLQFVKRRETFNAGSVESHRQETATTTEELKLKKEEKENLDSQIIKLKEDLTSLKTTEKETKTRKDKLERDANRNAQSVHGSTGRVS